MEWKQRDGVRWLAAELPGAEAAFSTRLGGVSEAPFEALNLGILTDDRNDSVLENRRRLAAALGLQPERVLMGMQVHGAGLLGHTAALQPSPYAEPGTPLTDADGHHTAQRGLVPLVLVADCLPVALAGSGGVAMLHCGWRGLAAGIVARRGQGRRRRGGRDRTGDRALLLRGRSRGAGALRAARRRDRREADARSGRGGPPAAAGGGGRADRKLGAVHPL